MNKVSRKAKMITAAIVNIIFFAALIAMIVNNADSLGLYILISLTHISVCGSLLYFIYIAPGENKESDKDTQVAI